MLTDVQRRALLKAPDGWFAACELADHAGNAFAALARRGLFIRRLDPLDLRRSQYRLTAVGQQMRTTPALEPTHLR